MLLKAQRNSMPSQPKSNISWSRLRPGLMSAPRLRSLQSMHTVGERRNDTSCTFASAGSAALITECRTLQCFQVPQAQRAILEQVRDKQTRRAPEKIEQIAYQPAAVLALIDGRLK